MAQNWEIAAIDGVIIKKLTVNSDSRGTLCETFRIDELPPGLSPVMSYFSYTRSGISRGPHEHVDQTDIIALIGPGKLLLKLWDNRPASPTYCSCMEVHVGRDNPLAVIIPPGVVHGYRNISKSESALVINYPNRLYRGLGKNEMVDEIRHEEDPHSPFRMD